MWSKVTGRPMSYSSQRPRLGAEARAPDRGRVGIERRRRPVLGGARQPPRGPHEHARRRGAEQRVELVVPHQARQPSGAAHREAAGRGQREGPGDVDLGIGARRHRRGAQPGHDQGEPVRERTRPGRLQEVLGHAQHFVDLLVGHPHLGEPHARQPVVAVADAEVRGVDRDLQRPERAGGKPQRLAGRGARRRAPRENVCGWRPSKRSVHLRDPPVARPVQGLDHVDLVCGDGFLVGHAQELAGGVAERPHLPCRAQLTVHGLVGPVLGRVGDRVPVSRGLHDRASRSAPPPSGWRPRRREGTAGGGRRASRSRAASRPPSRCSRGSRAPCRTARPGGGWCR